MKKRGITTLALATTLFVALAPKAAYAAPAPAGLVHEVQVQIPGYDGCTFAFAKFSAVNPILHTDGTTTVVEVGTFKVQGTGEFCMFPLVPTVVDIYDRSPALPTYHTSGVFGARQDVTYVGVPAITARSESADAAPVSARTNGVVAVEFRAPALDICLMDLWEVVSPGAATPLASFVPCPVVEP